MITNSIQQIVSAYEKCNLSIEDICENFEMEKTDVMAMLSLHSYQYRKSQEGDNGDSKDVSAEETKEMFEIIKRIARNQEHDLPSVAYKAAQFLINERKGRNDIPGMQTGNVNVVVVNQRLQGMKRAREAVSKKLTEKVAKKREAIEV